jgi:hypothetical protein
MRKALAVIGLASLLVLAIPYVGLGSVQLGGWLSSKVFDRGTDTQIVFDRAGAADTLIIFATAPTMTTQAASGVVILGVLGQATLHGTITDLHGMPSADVGFRWGYTAATMTNLTTPVTVTTTGAYSFVLNGFDPLQPVYYQAVGTTDGVTFATGTSFQIARLVDSFTGLDAVIIVTPLLLWLGLMIASGIFIYRGVKGIGVNNGVEVGLGLIFFTVAIFMFPIVLSVITAIRMLQ